MKKGLFITFEGGEGSGKSTLVEVLKEEFLKRENKVLTLREPGGNVVSEAIRNLVLDSSLGKLDKMTEALLFFASRNQLVKDVIEPTLNDGTMILCDRFYDSSRVYQGYAGGVSEKDLDALIELTCKNAKPDLTIYLDIEPVYAFNRKGGRDKGDRFEEKDIEFHNKVRNGFLSLAKKEPERIKVIDATHSVEEVKAEALKYIEELLK